MQFMYEKLLSTIFYFLCIKLRNVNALKVSPTFIHMQTGREIKQKKVFFFIIFQISTRGRIQGGEVSRAEAFS